MTATTSTITAVLVTEVRSITVVPGKPRLLVTVLCPYCCQMHRHSVSDDQSIQPGHQSAHCKSPTARMGNAAGYDVVWPETGLEMAS